MSQKLKLLIHQAQQQSPQSVERHQIIADIATAILAQRQVSRRPPQGSLSGIYLETLQAAEQELQQTLEQTIDQFNPVRVSVEVWSKTLREQIFQRVLNAERLQQFAVIAQQHSLRTEEWQYAATQLIQAIRYSGQLIRPRLLTQSQYSDVENRTLEWVFQHLQSYDPNRGDFMKWVNYRLGMIAREVQQIQKDCYVQDVQKRILQSKRQLKGLIQRTQLLDLKQWLLLYFKQVVADRLANWMIAALVVLLTLSSLLSQNSDQADMWLFKWAELIVGVPAQVVPIEDISQVETLVQPDDFAVSLSQLIRQYIETDPMGLCRKAIRGYPAVTFQVIALSYLNGEPWKEMAQRLGPSIPTLSNHYQRTLKALTPEIRKFIQDYTV